MAAPTAAIILCAPIFSGCKGPDDSARAELVCRGDGFTLRPDSLLMADGVALRAVGDSLIQVRIDGNTVRSLLVGSPDDAASGREGIRLHSAYPIIDALCRLESSAEVSADTDLPVRVPIDELCQSIVLNPLRQGAVEALKAHLRDGWVIPEETSGCGWPQVNDAPLWLMAAAETAAATMNPRWISLVAKVGANVAETDLRVSYNPRTGLFGGVSSPMAASGGLLPQWMGQTQLLMAHSLSLNTAYASFLQTMEAIGEVGENYRGRTDLPDFGLDADTMTNDICRMFWLARPGMLSAVACGSTLWPVPVDVADIPTLTMAAVTGAFPEVMTRTAIGTIAASGREPARWWPVPEDAPAAAPSLRLMALWTSAAARSGAYTEYERALGALVAGSGRQILDRGGAASDCDALTSVVMRGLLGLGFEPSRLTFAPAVPRWFGSDTRVENLRWRRATLDITLVGTGNKLASFTLDGHPADPFVAASVEGHHEIEIHLAGADTSDVMPLAGSSDTDEGRISSGFSGRTFTLPAAPKVEWIAPLRAAVLPGSGDGGSYRAWLNGVPLMSWSGRSFEFTPASDYSEVMIAAEGRGGLCGFPALPHCYSCPGTARQIRLADVAKSGTKVISDRKIAARLVESSRTVNRNLRIPVTIAREGDYLVDVHYLSGLGLVNARRRAAAFRFLTVNEVRAGVLVFPQQTLWQPDFNDDGWQHLSAYSNPLRVHLTAGENILELRYFQVPPVYADPAANALVADFIRLIRL